MSIRRLATPQDLAAVHAIYAHPDVVPYLGYDPMPLADFESVFAGLLAFYRENRQKGRSRHVVTLETLAIAPAEQGTGFAATMIGEAINLMRAAYKRADQPDYVDEILMARLI